MHCIIKKCQCCLLKFNYAKVRNFVTTDHQCVCEMNHCGFQTTTDNAGGWVKRILSVRKHREKSKMGQKLGNDMRGNSKQDYYFNSLDFLNFKCGFKTILIKLNKDPCT